MSPGMGDFTIGAARAAAAHDDADDDSQAVPNGDSNDGSGQGADQDRHDLH